MRAILFLTCAATLASLIANANAAVILPALGIAATEAEVSVQNQGNITVQQSIGTPGFDNPIYSPQARFAPTNSSIKAVASIYHLTASGLASANLATGQLKVGAASIYQSLSIPGNSQPSEYCFSFNSVFCILPF